MLKLSLHRQTLANLWILCKAVGQREKGDVLDAVMSCQISMKSETYLNGGRAHGKVVGVEENEAVSKHLPDLLWIQGCYDLLIKAFLSSSTNNRVTSK